MQRALPAALVVGLAVAVFALTVAHGFLFWDDRAFIAENPLVAHPSAAALVTLWTKPLLDLWAPLTWTLWATLAALGGPEPWLFHATNVLLHGANAWLVLRLLGRLPGLDGDTALAGALLFAVHPLQAETVAWASATKDLLSALGSLVALHRYLAFRARGDRAAWWQASLAFGGALLAKPSAVVTPVLALILDWLADRRTGRSRGAGERLRPLVPWLVAAAACTLVAARVQPAGERLHAVVPLRLRPALALDALAFYGSALVLPVRLVPDYGRTAAWLQASGALAWSWIPATVALAGAWVCRRRRPTLAAAVGIFVAAVLPVLGFVPFDFQYYSNVADHYVYLALLGPALGVAAASRAVPAGPRRLGVASLAAVLAVLTVRQAAHWRDDRTLALRTLAVNPRSFMAHNNLGQWLEERGRLDEAAAHYREALATDPGNGNALNNVGNVLYKQGRYDEAIRHYTSLPGPGGLHAPTAARMRNNLGAAYLKTARYDEAAAAFREAIRLDPAYPEPYYNLGLMLTAFGRRAEAVAVLRQGLAIAPHHPALRQQLAVASAP